jgi:hypothetical protein
MHDADAFSVLSDEPLPEDETAHPFGVRVITLRTAMSLVSGVLTYQIGRPVVNRRKLRRVLAEGQFDVVNFGARSIVGMPRPHTRPFFLFVGRLERIKGLDCFVIERGVPAVRRSKALVRSNESYRARRRLRSRAGGHRQDAA